TVGRPPRAVRPRHRRDGSDGGLGCPAGGVSGSARRGRRARWLWRRLCTLLRCGRSLARRGIRGTRARPWLRSTEPPLCRRVRRRTRTGWLDPRAIRGGPRLCAHGVGARGHEPVPPREQTRRQAGGGRRALEERAAAVFAEDVAHRVADLADRASRAERFLERRQQVGVAAGGLAELLEPLLHRRL